MFRSKRSLGIPIKSNQNTQLLAPCINCEDFIALDNIDQHSSQCTTVTQRVHTISNSSGDFDENDFRLSQLKANFHNKKYKHSFRLCRIIEIVMKINTIGCIEQASLKTFDQELQQMTKEPSQSINQYLYIERLHSLVLQRISIIQTQMIQKRPRLSQSSHLMALQNSLNPTKTTQTTRNPQPYRLVENKILQQEYVNLYKCQSPEPRMTSISKFPQNYSQTPNEQPQKQEILTHITEQTIDNLDQSAKPQTFMQRSFYSKVLNIKLTYPKWHAAQKIPVSILWKQAEKIQFKADKWDNFIRQCLDSPFKYIDPSKFNKQNQTGKIK